MILETTHEGFPSNLKVLPFQKGRPLACSSAAASADSKPIWNLGWISLADCKVIFSKSEIALGENLLVYLGSEEETAYWAIDVTDVVDDSRVYLGEKRFAFIELRTLMVATDWANEITMGELAIAGHVSGVSLLISI